VSVEPPPANNPGFFSNPARDLLGGLTAAIVALPLALAFGVQSGLGAEAGLYGAIACGIFAALFGGTPGQVSGPTGPMTVVTIGLLALAPGQPQVIFAAVVIAGLLQIAFGLFRLGEFIHYIPYPVISGFMTGIGVIIVVLQVPVLFGLKGGGGVLDMLGLYTRLFSDVNPAALGLGVGTLVTILIVKRFAPKLPAALVGLLLATVVAVAAGLDVPKIGEIPRGLPAPNIPLFEAQQVRIVVQAAIALALLGSIDSLLTSVVVDRITDRRHNSNKELVGQGIGNVVSGLFGGLPGAGATMRSVVNINTGGRSNLSGFFHGLVLLAVLLGLGRYTSHIPLACLAGILIHVGITIVDYRGLKSARTAPRSDTAVMVIVLLLTVFVDLIVAVIVGIAVASILFVKNLSDARMSEHGPLPEEQLPEGCREAVKGAVYVYTFKGPLNFGEAKNFSEVMFHLAGIRHVVLVFDYVPLIDQTGAFTVEDTIEQLQRKGVVVYLVHPYPHVRESLERIATRPEVIRQSCHDTLEAAVEAICAAEAMPAEGVESRQVEDPKS
jgi:SulP family sulfate permease